MSNSWDPARARAIVDAHAQLDGPLLPILHALNDAFGCVPEPATAIVADALNLSRAEVHGVISFYHDFRREPRGRLMVKLCRAEACQAMGATAINAAALNRLGLNWGETSADGGVTVEAVYCLGLCAGAPAALVGGEPLARFDAEQLIQAIEAKR